MIDFPGVDDQDDRISDLVNLLRTLSQLVVFVVNYKYIYKHAMYILYYKSWCSCVQVVLLGLCCGIVI